jgi:hypothetical protein
VKIVENRCFIVEPSIFYTHAKGIIYPGMHIIEVQMEKSAAA